jgi:hypothetical protein
MWPSAETNEIAPMSMQVAKNAHRVRFRIVGQELGQLDAKQATEDDTDHDRHQQGREDRLWDAEHRGGGDARRAAATRSPSSGERGSSDVRAGSAAVRGAGDLQVNTSVVGAVSGANVAAIALAT